MRKIIFILLFAISFSGINAQRITAYRDYKNYFVVFDDGATKELEYQPVGAFKIGGDFVGYMNADSSLKFYYKNNTYTLEESRPQTFECSENFLLYKMNRRLMMVESGNKTTLCEWASSYGLGDSIIAYVDYGDPSFKVYYGGISTTLETGTNEGGIKTFKVSQNLVAYIDINNNLKTFWHGKTYDLGAKADGNVQYAVGTDIVAFVNTFTNEFKVFYKGEILILDTTPPLSFQVNNSAVAYVDAGSNFNIFYGGETMFVSAFAPDFYSAKGNIVHFYLNNEFKAFFKGKNYLLEKVKPPTPYLIGNNTLAYIDNVNRLKLFDNGELRPAVSFEIVNKFVNFRDVLVYYVGNNTTMIFYKGKSY